MSILLLILSSIFLFIIKFNNLSIRISDTNIYFYTANEILQGKLLYKDIFFTNFPLFPYLSSFYLLILKGNLDLFFLTPTLEVILISFFIFFILIKKTNNYFISFISSLLYLFSFLVLSTSDHQTGVFLASLFAISGFLFFEKKQYLLSGFFIALTLLTKAYFLPVFISIITVLLLTNRKNAIKFAASFAITCIIILLPFLISTRNELLTDIFKYSLTRSAGLSKIEILWFFITHDFIFFVILIFNFFNIRKNFFFGSFSIFAILFIIFYNDIYYLYLNFMAPFLALSAMHFYNFIKQKINLQKMVIPTIVVILLFTNLFTYFSSYKNLQKFSNIDNIVKILKKEKPEYLYGVNDITPALSYLSEIPLLENIIDTNENIFRKKFLDAKFLTKKSFSEKTILVAHGAYYPQFNIEENILDGIFDKEEVKKNCKLLSTFPVQSEGLINRINLLKCY